MTASPARPRAGFTLVELLVAMALAVLVMALALGFAYSGAFASYKIVGAADRVSGWLLIAKQRAARDGSPVGVQFNAADVNGLTTGAKYVQGGASVIWVPKAVNPASPARVVFVYQADSASPPNITKKAYFVSETASELSGGPTDSIDGLATSAAGVSAFLDVILPGYGGQFTLNNNPSASVARVRKPDGTDPGFDNARELGLPAANYPNLGAANTPAAQAGSPLTPTLVTTTVAFKGPPTPLFGEPPLGLLEGTAVDLNLSRGLPALGGEILFSPSGQVLNQTSGAQIILWVRDPTLPAPVKKPDGTFDLSKSGEQSLVVISTKTGAIATVPVDTSPVDTASNDPYSNATAALNAGF